MISFQLEYFKIEYFKIEDFYMPSIETYLYNDILHYYNREFVWYHNDENNNLNQSGILNLSNKKLKRRLHWTHENSLHVHCIVIAR